VQSSFRELRELAVGNGQSECRPNLLHGLREWAIAGEFALVRLVGQNQWLKVYRLALSLQGCDRIPSVPESIAVLNCIHHILRARYYHAPTCSYKNCVEPVVLQWFSGRFILLKSLRQFEIAEAKIYLRLTLFCIQSHRLSSG